MMFDDDEDDSPAMLGVLQAIRSALGRSRMKSKLSPEDEQMVMVIVSPDSEMGEETGAEGVRNIASEVGDEGSAEMEIPEELLGLADEDDELN